MKKQLYILIAILCFVSLTVTSRVFQAQSSETSIENAVQESRQNIEQIPTAERIPRDEPKLNICGFYLGMSQDEVYDQGRKFGIHLEPGGISPHPCHHVSVDGQPLIISYDEESKLRWVAGPIVEFESGVILRHDDSLQRIREKLNLPLSEVESRLLCESSVQGFRVDPNLLISVLKDETLVFSIGPFDGWPIAREDGLTRQRLLEFSRW